MFTPEIKALIEVIGARLTSNSFGVLSDLKELMRPKKVAEGRWVRISTSGKLGLCHYDAYLHDICVWYCGVPEQVDGKWVVTSYNVRFHIGNLDDCSWGAWSKNMSKEEAIDMVEKIAPILDDLTELPTEDELNEMLRPFGMFGTFE